MRWANWSLRTRLSVSFILLFCIIGVSYVSLIFWSSERHYQEITQRINRSLAMYIVDRAPLIANGQVNHAAMAELSGLVMVVNPIVEVYLLNSAGDILAQGIPAEDVVRHQVDLAPIKRWLAEPEQTPVLGTDPRAASGRKVFSAFPVGNAANPEGFLYVILGGEQVSTLSDSLKASYSLQLAAGAIAALLVFGLAVGMLLFSFLTRPLRELSQAMQRFARQQQLLPEAQPAHSPNEIIAMSQTFDAMAARIIAQMQSLEETDRLRRELISNVSHDLRTPLASMQGYLEVLTVKDSRLSGEDRARYLATAHKHCQRLGQLISELFELSKLDAGRVEPNLEQFSLAELLQDVMHKFELNAREKNITLAFHTEGEVHPVLADIALIERVLENLVENALRYTPEGGKVILCAASAPEGVKVSVEDTGIGVRADDLPHLFDRYYRSQAAAIHSEQGTGLGLAIVKRILDLHGCSIAVDSAPGRGSCFRFSLAAA
ncbi:HAMP domain-containing histidine kinase [Simiduia sp. 21SJ11W-1]|uniref:sensor histidine kinase n=1 Tax=Simiduia sp. 21SJ11W-1 TaxID=2909669 RepID=UPI00209EDA73|nr:HAMP domain-containing sensor histidine kinase [Simiduia sp. 21SJ11W-1]UTA46906.1 HAMP domain-containing histidine kinase [Simiduia sp. 21SJ11W-1]